MKGEQDESNPVQLMNGQTALFLEHKIYFSNGIFTFYVYITCIWIHFIQHSQYIGANSVELHVFIATKNKKRRYLIKSDMM